MARKRQCRDAQFERPQQAKQVLMSGLPAHFFPDPIGVAQPHTKPPPHMVCEMADIVIVELHYISLSSFASISSIVGIVPSTFSGYNLANSYSEIPNGRLLPSNAY